MSELHADLSGLDLHGPFRYEQDADPGATGAGTYWLDTNSGPPRVLYRRNAANTGWDEVGGASAGISGAIFDAKGDLLGASAADTPARVAVGADFTYLRAASGESVGVFWQDFIGARVYASGTQSIATATATPVAFDTERFDTDAFHDNVTNNTRLTVPAGMGGKYSIWGAVRFLSNATNYRTLSIRLNGATTIGLIQDDTVASGVAWIAQVDTIYELAAGDYVELIAAQTSGGSLDIGSVGNYANEFALARWPG